MQFKPPKNRQEHICTNRPYLFYQEEISYEKVGTKIFTRLCGITSKAARTRSYAINKPQVFQPIGLRVSANSGFQHYH